MNAGDLNIRRVYSEGAKTFLTKPFFILHETSTDSITVFDKDVLSELEVFAPLTIVEHLVDAP